MPLLRASQEPLTALGGLQAPTVPIVPAPPDSSGYDLVAGLRLTVANDALSAIYQSGAIPHQIALDRLLSGNELAALSRGFHVDQPGGQISRLHITTPTLHSVTDGSGMMALYVPIQLDWIETVILDGRQIHQTVTDAAGTLQLAMRPRANLIFRPETNSSVMTLSVQLATLTPANSPRLILDRHSPVRLANPVPPDKVDEAAVLIQKALERQFHESLSFTVSPRFVLPTGDLKVRHVDVVTSGDVLIAGLQVAGTYGRAKPWRLSSLLPNSSANLFVQTHEAVANLLIERAVRRGALTSFAKTQNDNAVVDSAEVSFQNNSVVVEINGRVVNDCQPPVDLAFVHRRTMSIKMHGNSIDVDQKDDDCMAEASGLSDVGLFVSGGEGGESSTIIDLTSPIPGSDERPVLSAVCFRVTNGAMLMAATVGLRPDNVNTVMYVRFLEPDGIDVLAGATVQLMDRDAPALRDPPTGSGSQAIPARSPFRRRREDQRVAEGQTDLNGTVRFVLNTHKTPIPARNSRVEWKPDLYFRVKLPDGSVADTRNLPGGFMLDINSSRIGTLSNPLTFALGSSVNG